MRRIPVEELTRLMTEKLVGHGVPENVAGDAARLLAANSLDGIYSHGVNRFPRLVSYVDKGYIRPEARPECVLALGALERWDGNLGMGNTNAEICMGRAIELARAHGIGCVALANTNHWMRGGSYGIQAAAAGMVGICFTNTQPNMPAWGAADRRIGNNPLVLAVPDGESFVMVDGAMAQFSYGAIEAARMAGRMLPVPGGYDASGKETCDPAAIEATWRVLPIGYWKGSGLSVLLDMITAGLAAGNTVGDIGRLSEDEYAMCQTFIAVDARRANPGIDALVRSVLEDVHASQPVSPGGDILAPGEKELRIRAENEKLGIPVEDDVMERILSL